MLDLLSMHLLSGSVKECPCKQQTLSRSDMLTVVMAMGLVRLAFRNALHGGLPADAAALAAGAVPGRARHKAILDHCGLQLLLSLAPVCACLLLR